MGELRRETYSLELSLPFVCGVGIWNFLLKENGVTALMTGLVASCLLIVTCTLLAIRKKTAWSMAMLCCAGLLCAASADFITTEVGNDKKAVPGGEAIRSAIMAIPFSEKSSTGLLMALITGDRSMLDAHSITLFRQSGAAHLLALSGLHLGLIYAILSRILLIVGKNPAARKARSCGIVIFCLWFCLMAGSPASLERALIFIILREFARMSFRKLSLLRTLNDALVIQLVLKPGNIGSAGFQLSYLAVLGMATLYPKLERMFPSEGGKLEPMRNLWCAAALSLSCQLFTAPVSWYHFHSFPKYFLITNIISAPLMTALMLSGLAATTCSLVAACPLWLVRITEWFCRALSYILETISLLP